MLTAVQELSEACVPDTGYCSRVFYGKPVSKSRGARGTICLFEPNAVVGYEITKRSRVHGFLFRTLESSDPIAYGLAGVRPGVQLLISTFTRRQLERLEELLQLLSEPPDMLRQASDSLLLRAALPIFGRQPVDLIASGLRDFY